MTWSTLNDRITAARASEILVDIADIIDIETDKRREEIGPDATAIELVRSEYLDRANPQTAISALHRAVIVLLGKADL